LYKEEGGWMIDYLFKDERNRIVVVEDGSSTVYDEPVQTLFERWLNRSLTTYEGRKKAIARVFRIHRNLPVVLNQDTALAPLVGPRGEKTAYVNVCAVVDFEAKDETLAFVFASGAVWKTAKPSGWAKRFSDAARIRDYLYGVGESKKMLSWCQIRKRNHGNSPSNLV
jgi:hypothetical protein